MSNELDALLRQVASGDSAAFADVYDLTKTRVYGLVTRVLRDPGYGEETTQEVYLEVWRTASRYDAAKGSALAWLLTMAHRRCIELAYYEGLTYSQVSQRLAANLSTIKSRIRDALRGLRNCLDVP